MTPYFLTAPGTCLAQLVVVVFAFLVGCGGSGGAGGGSSRSDEPPTQPPAQSAVLEGRFVDGPVEGVEYRTDTISGVTGPDGTFQYRPGEMVEFTIGGTSLGRTMGAALVTPISLVSGANNDLDDTVGNIAQLLQSLDDDGDPENGIQISASMRTLAASRTLNLQQSADAFNTDAAVIEFVATLTGNSTAGQRSLVARVDAQRELRRMTNWSPSLPCTQRACFRVVEMWSDQFAGATGNGFSEISNDFDAGHEGNRRGRILMAARADNVAHFRTTVVSVGDIANAYVRLSLNVANDTFMVGGSHPLRGDVMNLSVDLYRELPAQVGTAGPLDFAVSVGTDLDGDGELDENEVDTSSERHFLVVPEWTYQNSVNYIQSIKWLLPPLTRDFFNTFLGQAPASFPSRAEGRAAAYEGLWSQIRALTPFQFDIFRPENEIYPFSHRVGIDFANVERIGIYDFPATSSVGIKLRNSDAFKSKVVDRLIAQRDAGVTSSNMRTALRFGLLEPELDMTFGTVYIFANLGYDISCVSDQLRISNVRVNGTLYDLYDFNYFDTNPVIENIVEAMASIQAGFRSFGAGRSGFAGEVFEVVVHIGWPLPEYENRVVGACPSGPAPPCTSLVGSWVTNTTYTWRCHGSFAGLSRRSTEVVRRSIPSEDEVCRARFDPPITRSGTGGNTFSYARSVVPSELAGVNATFYNNPEIYGDATVSDLGQRIDLKEYGMIDGYVGNEPGRCLTDAVSVWSR